MRRVPWSPVSVLRHGDRLSRLAPYGRHPSDRLLRAGLTLAARHERESNGLLRQYLPRRSDLSAHDLTALTSIADELNGRPRKALDWDTPAERMAALLDPA